MATPSILRRIGDTAKKYSPFPDDNEVESLKSKQQMVNQVAPTKEEAPKEKPQVGETINSGAKYGDRPGEKRLDWAMKPIPVYDEGGDVKVPEDHKMVVKAGPDKPEDYEPRFGSEAAVANRPEVQKPDVGMKTIPLYDEGGDVNVNDGKHQVAVLQDGERVLTPEEAKQYNEGFPSATPEEKTPRVLPNSEGIVPEDSESIKPKQMRFPGGAKLNTDLAPMETPQGDISNTEGNQVESLGKEASATVPSADTLTGRKPKLDPNSPVGMVLQHDKEQAAMKGDLVGMGKAVLNEKHLATDVDAAHGTGEVSHQAKIQDYDTKIQQAMDKAAQTNDPAYQEQADRLKLAKMDYEKMTPWGSATNHPGILGKIGHVAAKVGNIAGDVLAPNLTAIIPGTDLNKEYKRSALGSALKEDTESRIQDQAEKNKMKLAELGKTPEQITFRDLLKQINPNTGQPYTPEEALQETKGAEAKEKESYINDQQKQNNPTTGKPFTREEATESYYKMRAGVKPPNEKEAEIKDYLNAKHLQDTPENRDLARQEVVRRKTDISAKAALPYAEQKLRLQSELAESNQELGRIGANALQRGEKADEFVQKENARHGLRVTQLDAAQNALDASDTNMLAASIVPILATMTETTAQGIKRLNPQELARFMPKSSGDAKQWFEAHYDQLTAGQIPETYRADLRDLLNNLAQEESTQNGTNLKSIDETFKQGATVPVVNDKGKATTTKKPEPAAHQGPPNGTVSTGRSKADGKLHYLDANHKSLGLAPEPENK